MTAAQRRDAITLLERITGQCTGGPNEHDSCARCTAIALLQEFDPLALKLVRLVIADLKAEP
jgi:hypothetical protein